MTTRIGKSNFVGLSQSSDSKPGFGNPLNHPPAEGGMRNTTLGIDNPEQDIVIIVNNAIAEGTISTGIDTSNGITLSTTGGPSDVVTLEIDIPADPQPNSDYLKVIARNNATNGELGLFVSVGATGGFIGYQDDDPTTQQGFNIGTNSTFYESTAENPLNYQDDYSANFSDRSMVDKAYITPQSGTGDPNGSVTSRYFGDLYIDTSNNFVYYSIQEGANNQWGAFSII
jgi:hypothetical protein